MKLNLNKVLFLKFPLLFKEGAWEVLKGLDFLNPTTPSPSLKRRGDLLPNFTNKHTNS